MRKKVVTYEPGLSRSEEAGGCTIDKQSEPRTMYFVTVTTVDSIVNMQLSPEQLIALHDAIEVMDGK